MSLLKKALLVFFWISMMARPVYSSELSVACAANFTAAMKELAQLYEQESRTRVICTFGSTGMLYSQIKNGAPYSIFFAADEKRPYLLYKAGLADKPFNYVKGSAVLWSRDSNFLSETDWRKVLLSPAVQHIGMANPETAPYGEMAMKALGSTGLLEKVQSGLVYGKSVGISFQYGYSGAADISFIALSQALSDKGRTGKYWEIPEAGKILQAACVLKSDNSREALAFANWMESPPARYVIGGYGYE